MVEPALTWLSTVHVTHVPPAADAAVTGVTAHHHPVAVVGGVVCTVPVLSSVQGVVASCDQRRPSRTRVFFPLESRLQSVCFFVFFF